MAKSTVPNNKPTKYPFPTVFGSHKSMVDETLTKELNDQKLVVIKDEFGTYQTEVSRLDDGLSDPNRYGKNRMFDANGGFKGGTVKE